MVATLWHTKDGMPEVYKNLIFTKHGLNRMLERSITAESVYQTVSYPNKEKNEGRGSKKFVRTISGRKYHVIAQWKSIEQKWLIISVWVRGENDRVPLSVQIVLLPFRLLWWVIKKILFFK